MSKYRKKPIVIEAVRFEKPYSRVKDFCPDMQPIRSGNRIVWAVVPTLEGDMRADLGDWIIRGVKGEFYPCKPDVFAVTYEPCDV
jgi:hypothetical protein